jgi:hypothetical protein
MLGVGIFICWVVWLGCDVICDVGILNMWWEYVVVEAAEVRRESST